MQNNRAPARQSMDFTGLSGAAQQSSVAATKGTGSRGLTLPGLGMEGQLKVLAVLVVSVLFVGLGLALLPRALPAMDLLAGPRDEAAVAGFVISQTTPDDFAAEAERALAAGDEDLAASVAALAAERGISLPADLSRRIATAQEEASGRALQDAWDGFVSGEAPTEAALAGAVAADLSGAGDIRDLYRQAENYFTGAEVDPLMTGLAAVGLGITAATVASSGMALPARTGLSALKAAKRAGRLSPALAREVGTIAAEGMKGRGLKATALAFERLGADIATIGRNSGYRGAMQALGTAKSADEVGAIARLSTRYGKATRAVLAMGGAAVTFASLTATAAFWTISALLWVLTALLGVTRLAFSVGRWLWPKPRARRQAGRAGFSFGWVASQPIMTSATTTMGKTA